MLRHTFVHAEGIGRSSEKKLWQAGAHTWDCFLELHEKGQLCGPRMDDVAALVRESRVALFARDSAFFQARLPKDEIWRMYSDFADEAAYVDIETTGLRLPSLERSDGGGDGGGEFEADEVTVIGLYDGRSYHAFVRGQDLELFPEVAARYPLLVTYNGARFDVPFLQRTFRRFQPRAHLDLRFPLARLGYRGGLKSIERQVGLARPGEVAQMNGFDAVLLWRRHLAGEAGALKRLVAYTQQDVENLKPLAERAVRELRGKLAMEPAVGEAA